jgi:hypothetical protein
MTKFRTPDHRLPISKLNYNNLLPPMTKEEAEAVRAEIMTLSDALYSTQVRERSLYGMLIGFFLGGILLNACTVSPVLYHIADLGFDLGIAVGSVSSYIAYRKRVYAENAYWKAVFGDNYSG